MWRGRLWGGLSSHTDGQGKRAPRVRSRLDGWGRSDEPHASLIEGSDGNFYGTTEAGGSENCSGGCGSVFKITPQGIETPVYLFALAIDGISPSSGLFQGSTGDYYGVTESGGTFDGGTIFDVSQAGMETVLHSFATH